MKQPATPLPWHAHADGVFKQWGNAGNQQRIATLEAVPEAEAQPNAAYVVHACNAYPRLITALRNVARQVKAYDGQHADIIALLNELEGK